MRVLVTLDGVLVGGAPLRGAICRAAGLYLEKFCHVEFGRRLVPDDLVRDFARVGGFEHPWEMVSALVYYYLSSLISVLRPPLISSAESAEELHEAFRDLGLRYAELRSHNERDLHDFLETAGSRGGGFEGIQAALRFDTMYGYVLDLGTLSEKAPENLIGRTLEEVYWGSARFASSHPEVPRLRGEEGFFEQESLHIPLKDLASLAEVADLVLLSTRSHEETRSVLELLGCGELFVEVRCREGQPPRDRGVLRSLLRAELESTQDPALTYVLSNEVAFLEHAKEQGCVAIGFLQDRTQRRALEAAHPRAVISRVGTLVRALQRKKGQ